MTFGDTTQPEKIIPFGRRMDELAAEHPETPALIFFPRRATSDASPGKGCGRGQRAWLT
jgi:hypothetical protein